MSKVTPFPVTTDTTLRRDLLASLNERGVPVGPTWGAFKAAVEGFGVTDRTPLESIEFGVMQDGSGRIVLDEDEGVGVSVREMSAAWLRIREGK